VSVGIALSILASVLGIVSKVLGDYFLAKWVTAARVWWEQHAGAALKAKVAEDFERWKNEEDDLNAHLPGGS
jgi:hypothetical protein